MNIPLYYLLHVNYPSITIGYNSQVQLVNHNDGNGDQIGVWDVPGITQPSVEQLIAWQNDPNIQAAYQAILNTEANKAILQQLDDLDRKSIRPIRENDTAMLATLTAQAVALRAQLLPMTAAGVLALGHIE